MKNRFYSVNKLTAYLLKRRALLKNKDYSEIRHLHSGDYKPYGLGQ